MKNNPDPFSLSHSRLPQQLPPSIVAAQHLTADNRQTAITTVGFPSLRPPLPPRASLRSDHITFCSSLWPPSPPRASLPSNHQTLTVHRCSDLHHHHGFSLPSPLVSASILVWMYNFFGFFFLFLFLAEPLSCCHRDRRRRWLPFRSPPRQRFLPHPCFRVVSWHGCSTVVVFFLFCFVFFLFPSILAFCVLWYFLFWYVSVNAGRPWSDFQYRRFVGWCIFFSLFFFGMF